MCESGEKLLGWRQGLRVFTIGALIIRIRFWGPLYYTYNKEPQKSIGNYLGSHITPISDPYLIDTFFRKPILIIYGPYIGVPPGLGNLPDVRHGSLLTVWAAQGCIVI